MGKVVGAIIGGLTGTLLAVWGIVALWSSVVVPLIPVNEYTGLIKLGIGLVLFLTLGGLGFWFVVAFATLCGGLVASLMPEGRK